MRSKKNKDEPCLGRKVELDKREAEFDYLVSGFRDGKISYETLMDNFPDHDEGFLKKLLRKLLRWLA